jgi:hypothetical protein
MIKSTFSVEKSQYYEMSLDPTNLHYFENNTVLLIEKSCRYYQSAKTILSSNFHHVGEKQLGALNNSGLIKFCRGNYTNNSDSPKKKLFRRKKVLST